MNYFEAEIYVGFFWEKLAVCFGNQKTEFQKHLSAFPHFFWFVWIKSDQFTTKNGLVATLETRKNAEAGHEFHGLHESFILNHFIVHFFLQKSIVADFVPQVL
jgi:hypothetical protein